MLELNKIYHADCLDKMGEIDDESIDFILCDLPYAETNNDKDIIIPFEPLWQHYRRIIKPNGCICLFAQGLFYVDLVNSARDLFRYDLVWDKILSSGFLNANRKPLRVHEQIAVFYKSMPKYNPQMWQGEPLHGKGTNYKKKPVINQNYGEFEVIDDTRKGSTEKYPLTILSCQKPHPSIAVHRTQKPEALLEYLIKTYTDKGDLVLDNCSGSGSTAIACHNTKRNFICIEKDEEYFNLSQERVRVARMRKTLI